MQATRIGTQNPLTALLIAPNRALAAEFTQSLRSTRAFQLMADLSDYPNGQTLGMRLRQFVPDALLVDVSADPEQGLALVAAAGEIHPGIQVICLHVRNDSGILLRALRLGASDFLFSPFEAAAQRDALARICRISATAQVAASRKAGTVLAFSSAKSGCGATVLALQTALAIQRITRNRVFLADMDSFSATASFFFGAGCREPGETVLTGAGEWTMNVKNCLGLDVLPALSAPPEAPVDPGYFHEFCEHARNIFDWVVLDLPAIFHSVSLAAFSEADHAFLISTPDLVSLHLARKAIKMLLQCGFAADRFQVLLNRASNANGLSSSDIEKIFEYPVSTRFPDDRFFVERALASGEMLEPGCEMEKKISGFASQLAGIRFAEKPKDAPVVTPWPVLSET